MGRKLLTFIALLAASQAVAQLTLATKVHDYGTLLRETPRWADFRLNNLTNKEVVIFRVEGPDYVDVKMSRKIIPPDSSAWIRLQINPVQTGFFREELKVFASAWNTPESIVLTGESVFALDRLLPCPDFSNIPASASREVHFTIRRSESGLQAAKVTAFSRGRKVLSATTNERGELSAKLTPGVHILSFTAGTHTLDTVIYIHGINQHVQLMLPVSPPEQIQYQARKPKEDKEFEKVYGTNQTSDEIPTPAQVESSQLPLSLFKPSNIVFLVDVSTSMKHEGRMELLKVAMIDLLDVLRPVDKFTLISYASDTRLIIETQTSLDKVACIEAIQGLIAQGGTEGARALEQAGRKALQHAIKDGNNQIILATDGAFNEGAALAKKIAAKYLKKGVTTSVIGIKCGKYTTKEMSELAAEGGGRFTGLQHPDDAGEQLINEIKMSAMK